MKFCIFSGHNIGGTFLDWSVHFLSGKTEYYSSLKNQFIPLVQDPIDNTIGNAHRHLKNHPTGFEQTKLFLENCNQDCLYSMYAATKMLKHSVNDHSKLTKENFNLLQQQRLDDDAQMFALLSEQNVPTIHLAGESEIPLYFTRVRTTDTYLFKEGTPTSESDIDNDFHTFFFERSIDNWTTLGLTDRWDVRERNALNIRPLDMAPEYYLPNPHLRIDCREFWYNGVAVINRVMNYLKLDIDSTRFEAWKDIYNKWRQQHIDSMEFVYNCDHIVSAIVNNWNYKIDLTFNQEVVILHFLIYKHNLNLKSWQLEKFPDNTQKLHQLLEPNIHQVDKIY